MDFMKVLGTVFAFCCYPRSAAKLFSGQRICRRGTERPCYRIVHSHDSQRKVNFEEASQTCRSDGGELLSIETESEQRLVENFILGLHAADGGFWIGLQRTSRCPTQYRWLDGSQTTFRNWHLDEPLCGFEVCVAMFSRLSAPKGSGGLHVFQWSADDCSNRNNFICKYSLEKRHVSTTEKTSARTDAPATSFLTKHPGFKMNDENTDILLSESTDKFLHVEHIVLLAVGLFLGLLLLASVLICFKLIGRRRTEGADTASKRSKGRGNSPNSNVYDTVGRQQEAGLVDTGPDIWNTSVQGSSSESPSGEYENLPGKALAGAESGFVTNEIYETCQSRFRSLCETGWVENEIYGC